MCNHVVLLALASLFLPWAIAETSLASRPSSTEQKPTPTKTKVRTVADTPAIRDTHKKHVGPKTNRFGPQGISCQSKQPFLAKANLDFSVSLYAWQHRAKLFKMAWRWRQNPIGNAPAHANSMLEVDVFDVFLRFLPKNQWVALQIFGPGTARGPILWILLGVWVVALDNP